MKCCLSSLYSPGCGSGGGVGGVCGDGLYEGRFCDEPLLNGTALNELSLALLYSTYISDFAIVPQLAIDYPPSPMWMRIPPPPTTTKTRKVSSILQQQQQ